MEQIKQAVKEALDQRTEVVSKPEPRTAFRSRWYSETISYDKNGGKIVKEHSHSATYRKPATDEPKGKAAIKAAKRERVKAMKAAQLV